MPAFPIYATRAIRKLEELAASASGALMERAGRAAVLSLRVARGTTADRGAVGGAGGRASHTLTFIAHKPGLLTLDGPDHCGELRLDTLGIDPAKLLEPEGMVLDEEILVRAIAPRPGNFHKGQAGSVGVLGGAAGMVGAAGMAGAAPLKCGA